MSVIKLIVDDRERAVIDELKRIDSLSETDGAQWWYVRRLAHGDYAFTCERDGVTATFMIIERKTYSDFAQSIKDSRIDNMTRLIALRAEIKAECNQVLRIAILLEGPRLDCDDRVDGIPVKCIRAKIDHMWLRDDIYLIEVPSVQDTAQYLRSIAANAKSLHKKMPNIFCVTPVTISSPQLAPGTVEGCVAPPWDSVPRPARCSDSDPLPGAPSDSVRAQNIEGIGRDSGEVVQSVAMRRIAPPTILGNVEAMFAQFPGVGKIIAGQLARSGISIADFVRGELALDSTKHGGSVENPEGIARLSEKYRATRTTEMDIGIIAHMHGVSEDMSKNGIINSPTQRACLAALCELSRDELSHCITWHGRIMKKIGQNLYDCLHYAHGPR